MKSGKLFATRPDIGKIFNRKRGSVDTLKNAFSGDKKKAHIFLSIGSNQGDREGNLEKAFSYIGEIAHSVRISSIYETLPLYFRDQSRFLNCVLEGDTGHQPFELLDFVLSAEACIGRTRETKQKYGPRVIDIDILLYDNIVMRRRRLEIPHPRMYERQFVLIPLVELNPEIIDPASGKKFAYYLDALDDQGVAGFIRSQGK